MYVILTVDVETYTGRYERDVYADGHGLPFILETCNAGGCRATHYVEALGATQWGIGPLRDICRDITRAGHDIQLHLHPVVARLEGFEDHEDVLHHRDLATQTMLMRTGLRLLREAGGTSVTSFRAGDFAANEDTLRAMRAAGLRVSSNRDLDQKSSIRSQLNAAFPIRNDAARRDDMIDIPVHACLSPYPFLDRRYRHLEISAMGGREMCDALVKMERAGYACACILTHPGEFFRWRHDRVEPIRKNQRRLRDVVRFVQSHARLQWATIQETVDHLPAEWSQPPDVRLNPIFSAMRIWEQAFDRLRARV